MQTITVREVLRDERGIAVVVGLIALMTLTALVLAFLAVSAWEPQISRNLADGTRARYVAEAGLESVYDTLISNTNWNGLLAGSGCTTANDGSVVGTASSTLPGLTTASGTYTVRVRNDCRATDNVLTGVTTEGNATDANDRVILTAVGTFGTAQRTMAVVVSRVPNLFNPGAPPSGQLNAALSFPGYEADTYFSGDSFIADGRNHDLNGNLTTGNAMFGISVGPENQFVPQGGPVMHHEDSVQNSLSSAQKDNIRGKNESDPSATTTGNSTIQADLLTSKAVTDFVNVVKDYADITINSTHAAPVSVSNIGSNCGSNYASTSCWGTSAQPKIVVVKGDVDPTSLFNALRVSGTSTGAGILIIQDGDFSIRDNFSWEGPIIVTGGYVGVGMSGTGTQQIIGAMISNETATNEASGFYEGLVQGSARVKYSRAAIDKALALLAGKVPGGTGGQTYIKVTMYNFQEL